MIATDSTGGRLVRSPRLARRLKFRGSFIGRRIGRQPNFRRANAYAAGRVPRARGKHEPPVACVDRLPRGEGFSGGNKDPTTAHPRVVLTLPRPVTVQPHEWRTWGGRHRLYKGRRRWIRNLHKGLLRMDSQRWARHGRTAGAECCAHGNGQYRQPTMLPREGVHILGSTQCRIEAMGVPHAS